MHIKSENNNSKEDFLLNLPIALDQYRAQNVLDPKM